MIIMLSQLSTKLKLKLRLSLAKDCALNIVQFSPILSGKVKYCRILYDIVPMAISAQAVAPSILFRLAGWMAGWTGRSDNNAISAFN